MLTKSLAKEYLLLGFSSGHKRLPAGGDSLVDVEVEVDDEDTDVDERQLVFVHHNLVDS